MDILFVLVGTEFRFSKLEMLEIPDFLCFLQCIKVWFIAILEKLKILLHNFLSSVRAVKLVPGSWKGMSFASFWV